MWVWLWGGGGMFVVLCVFSREVVRHNMTHHGQLRGLTGVSVTTPRKRRVTQVSCCVRYLRLWVAIAAGAGRFICVS